MMRRRKSRFFSSIRSNIQWNLNQPRVFRYIINITEVLRKDIFNTEIFLEVYNHLAPRTQDKFNKRIQNFLLHHIPKFFEGSPSLRNITISKLYRYKDNFESDINFLDKGQKSSNPGRTEEIVNAFLEEMPESLKDLHILLENSRKKIQEEYLNMILNFFHEEQNFFLKNKEFQQEEKGLNKKLQYLQKFLNLESIEKEIIKFIYDIHFYPILNTTFNEMVERYGLIKTISFHLRLEENKIKKALNKQEKLQQFFIVDIIDTQEIYLNEEIFEYLSDLSTFEFTDRFFKVIDETKENILDLKLFHFYKNKINIIQDLLLSPGSTNILFYGKSGTGKTSLSKSIIHSIGKKIIYVATKETEKNHIRDNLTPSNRMLNLIMACNYAKENNGIVIMDEADEFLNSHFSPFSSFLRENSFSDAVSKNWLNNFLENHNSKIIWITNHTSLMDESVKRRFNYSIAFHNFNGETREFIIKELLKKYNLQKKIHFQDLQEYFLDISIPIGIIDNGLKQIHQILQIKRKRKSELLQIAKEILNSNCELIFNRTFLSHKSFDKTFYNINFINSSPSPEEIIRKIKGFIQNQKHHNKNFNLIFYGITGTGKTQFARYLAHQLNYRILELTPSDIMNPFFGMTEKYLNHYFTQISSRKCILILNEIDAFLSKKYINSDIYHSIVMQWIQNMENHTGIFIGTTNYIHKLPASVIRRFHIKAEFFPLTKEQIPSAFLQFFGNHLPVPQLTSSQKEKLQNTGEITLGDLHSVKRQIEYEGELYFEEIHRLLKDEIYYRLHQKN